MQTNPNPVEIRKFELDLRLVDGAQRFYDYHSDSDCVSASLVTRECLGKRQAWAEPESIDAVSHLLEDIAPLPRMSEYELLERARAGLHIDNSDILRLAVDVEFSDGSKVGAQTAKTFLDAWNRHSELSSLP